MHETRNFVLTLLLMGAIAWAFFNWLVAPEFFRQMHIPLWLKVSSLVMVAALGAALFMVYRYEDPMDDELARITGGRYYEHNGLCFMPLIRVIPGRDGRDGQAEISLYYQNRFSHDCEAIIHMRPPPKTFATHRGARDVHFAFRARPGGFGVVHQAIAVHPKAQGEEIEVQLAAAVHWPLSHGDELRSHNGVPCGTFNVDWALAYRQTEHELGGEIELQNPVILHLTMPLNVKATCPRHNESTQETITALT